MSSLTGNTGFNAGPRQTSTKSMKPKGYSQFSQYTPEQHLASSNRQQLAAPDSYLSQIAGGDEEAFNQIEAPAMRQFAGLQGNLASRFSGMGGGFGAQKSSGFQNTMNQAGSDFAQELASKRHGMRTDAIKSLNDMYGEIMNESPYGLVEKKKPFWQELALESAPHLIKAGGKAAMAGF